jgi:hypothetical protein
MPVGSSQEKEGKSWRELVGRLVSGWLKREIFPENLRPEIDGFLGTIPKEEQERKGNDKRRMVGDPRTKEM